MFKPSQKVIYKPIVDSNPPCGNPPKKGEMVTINRSHPGPYWTIVEYKNCACGSEQQFHKDTLHAIQPNSIEELLVNALKAGKELYERIYA